MHECSCTVGLVNRRTQESLVVRIVSFYFIFFYYYFFLDLALHSGWVCKMLTVDEAENGSGLMGNLTPCPGGQENLMETAQTFQRVTSLKLSHSLIACFSNVGNFNFNSVAV